jgi:hypothetical protein
MLPIPCTIQPSTAEHLKKKGMFIHPKMQVLITAVLDGAYEGGVMCTIETHNSKGEAHALIVSITHVIIKPKHKAEMRVQAYQRKRIAEIARDKGITLIKP